jgi:hypothetical protein
MALFTTCHMAQKIAKNQGLKDVFPTPEWISIFPEEDEVDE